MLLNMQFEKSNLDYRVALPVIQFYSAIVHSGFLKDRVGIENVFKNEHISLWLERKCKGIHYRASSEKMPIADQAIGRSAVALRSDARLPIGVLGDACFSPGPVTEKYASMRHHYRSAIIKAHI